MFTRLWRRQPRTRRPGQTFRRSLHRKRLVLEALEIRTLLSFLAPANYATGGPPVSMATAEFTADHQLDLVTGNSDGTVSVLLGKGDGSFQAPQNYVVGSGIVSVAVGDFNGDGKPDLVASSSAGTTLFLGNGDGTFQAGQAIGVNWGQLAVGDFNGDNRLDVVTSDGKIFLGNGDGTFQPPRDVGAVGIPAVGDFNHDGKLDLAMANGSFNGMVSVLLGNGDGSFQTPQVYPTGSWPLSIAVADINGDGNSDLVVANSAEYGGTASVSILFGNGDGSFQAARNYDAGPRPFSVAVADLNADGRMDLAVANDSYGTVTVLLGNGDGSFQAPQTVDVGLQPSTVVAADFNGDGALDLATANSYSGESVSIRLNNGDGTFQALPKYDDGLGGPAGPVVAGDFLGNGITGVAMAGGGTVSVLVGNGDGTFQAPRTSSFDGIGSAVSLAVGDFNGDGQLDLVVVTAGDLHHPGSVSVLLGNGDGTFRTSFGHSTLGSFSSPVSVGVADFNGDDQLDLVVSNLDSLGSVSVLLGNGDGTFQAPQDYLLGPWNITLAVADLNRDGHPDIVTANTSNSIEGSVSILLGNGDGTFQDPQTIPLDHPTGVMLVGDLTGNGTPDLVLNDTLYPANEITVLLGNGDGTFQAPITSFVGSIVRSMALADFNQDGRLDLAVGVGGGNGPNGVSVLLGNGDGSFQPTSISYGSGASVGAVADFTGDQFPDVVTANPRSNSVSVLINAADWAGGPAVLRPPSSSAASSPAGESPPTTTARTTPSFEGVDSFFSAAYGAPQDSGPSTVRPVKLSEPVPPIGIPDETVLVWEQS